MNFSFPELLLPQIEEVEYSFVAASANEPWVQHRVLKNGTEVTVQFSQAVQGSVTMAVNQAVHGLPGSRHQLVNAFSGLCLDSNGGSVTTDGNPVDTWTCVDAASNAGLPNLGAESVFHSPRKTMSSYSLLKWGVTDTVHFPREPNTPF